MQTAKVTQVGNSLAVIIPKEAAQRLGLRKGDEVHLLDTGTGLELRPHHPEVDAQVEAAKAILAEWREAFAILAKQ